MAESIRWHEWSEGSFSHAAAANRPVLLSLMTSWSDECAAMDRTTYAHPAVVSLIEDRFVAIRVDADRRPDVNERYNLGGWPTTACLTSTGELLNGATYLGVDQMIALLQQVSDLWRSRSQEILEKANRNPARPDRNEGGVRLKPDLTAVDYFRSLLIEQFDPVNGGFGGAPKLPHARALMFALVLADDHSDPELFDIVEMTLDRMSALWDSASGGFFRYADGADWSRPGSEKTLEDNAALLHIYIEAAARRRSDEFRNRAIEIVRWIRGTLADQIDGGFYNAVTGARIDRSMYVDRNAEMVSAFLRAAVAFDDPWLRDFALKSFEAVVVPGYSPGAGVAHAPGVRGLLTDQIRVTGAVIWAHVLTGQLPYSMLAAELAQFTIRTMWDAEASAFRDRASEGAEIGLLKAPLRPFDMNCDAACVLERLSVLTGDSTYHDRAVAILGAFASEYRNHELFGVPYALAIREVINGKPPLGLELTRVDWGLQS